jgi:orotidine-5'-phosphate decarboxylase
MKNPFIIALDFPNKEEVKSFLAHFPYENLFVKVGMELFYQEGPSIISELKKRGHSIFLDLKLHDIPNTVKRAMIGLASLGVDIVNVHAAGGTAMMEAALEGLEKGTHLHGQRPLCLAVTQLTSTSEEVMRTELLINHQLQEVVFHYASLAKQSGLDGIVCSALEAGMVKDKIGEGFLTVTPGIRLNTDYHHDQIRVVTPSMARELGAGAIVVGRSITKAKDPLHAYKMMKSAWEGIHDES